jgi:hypothetical protein
MLLRLPRCRLWTVQRFGGRLGNGGFWLPLGISWAAWEVEASVFEEVKEWCE